MRLFVILLAGCCPEVDGARLAFVGTAEPATLTLHAEDSDTSARVWTIGGGDSKRGALRGCLADAEVATVELGFALPLPYVIDEPVPVDLDNDSCRSGLDPNRFNVRGAVDFQSPTSTAITAATGTLTVRQTQPLAIEIDATFTDATTSVRVVGTATYTAARVTQPCY